MIAPECEDDRERHGEGEQFTSMEAKSMAALTPDQVVAMEFHANPARTTRSLLDLAVTLPPVGDNR